MPRFAICWLCVVLLCAGIGVQAAETITVGGALVTIPQGWSRADASGRIVLTPGDLPQGVVCSLMLLGGESFTGSVMGRLAVDWKALESSGKITWDDGGKLDGAGGPVEIASRAGTIQADANVSIHVWMVNLHANQRVERMIFITNTTDTFKKHVPAVGTLINGIKFVPVQEPAAPNPAGTLGHMRYTVPQGWTEKQFANGAILKPDNVPTEEHLELRLMPSSPAEGTLPKALDTAWDDACAQLGASRTRTVNNTAYSTEAPRKSFKGWDYARATGIITSNADQGDYTLDLFVIKINERFERLAVVSRMRNHNLQRCSFYDSPVHRQTILDFVFSVKFDDWQDAVVEPASLKGDGIVGVWQGISMFGGTFKAAYAIFYTNGQVFFGSRFPMAGCDQQNTWIEAEQTPRYWGSYSVQGDAGLIKMTYGEIPVQRKGNNLVLTTNGTEHSFVRVPPVDGARFDGKYVMAEAYETIPVITFTADGQFKDEGALRVLEHEYMNPFAVAKVSGTGTYSVQNHSITFFYADGKMLRLAFPGTDYDKTTLTPASLALSFNHDPLKRK